RGVGRLGRQRGRASTTRDQEHSDEADHDAQRGRDIRMDRPLRPATAAPVAVLGSVSDVEARGPCPHGNALDPSLEDELPLHLLHLARGACVPKGTGPPRTPATTRRTLPAMTMAPCTLRDRSSRRWRLPTGPPHSAPIRTPPPPLVKRLLATAPRFCPPARPQESGNDDATVSGGIDLPAILDGGEGDDRLNGGNGGNILIGGRGN